jgi:hypothetical protein
MNFTVIWLPIAELALTELWLAGRNRLAIQEAADRIDLQLANDPMAVGESRSENF